MANKEITTEFIPADKVDRHELEQAQLALSPRLVVKHVHTVFDMIGGVSAMASWALDNPDKFYTQIYTKMMPNPNAPIHGSQEKLTIIHAVPPNPLDE
jgi:hypothetical protein